MTDHVVVLGDFNALKDDPNNSLSALQTEWFSEMHRTLPLPDAEQDASAIIDGVLIDFIMISPSLAAHVTARPSIYAYDHDSSIFLPSPFDPLQVSDHRPVVCSMDL